MSGIGIGAPGVHDVLCGRGGHGTCHPGNVLFRAMIRQHKARYLSATKAQKMAIAAEVADLWHQQSPPGRFLKRNSAGSNTNAATNTTWLDIGSAKACIKVSQCLREKSPAPVAVARPTTTKPASRKTTTMMVPTMTTTVPSTNSRQTQTHHADPRMMRPGEAVRTIIDDVLCKTIIGPAAAAAAASSNNAAAPAQDSNNASSSVHTPEIAALLQKLLAQLQQEQPQPTQMMDQQQQPSAVPVPPPAPILQQGHHYNYQPQVQELQQELPDLTQFYEEEGFLPLEEAHPLDEQQQPLLQYQNQVQQLYGHFHRVTQTFGGTAGNSDLALIPEDVPVAMTNHATNDNDLSLFRMDPVVQPQEALNYGSPYGEHPLLMQAPMGVTMVPEEHEGIYNLMTTGTTTTSAVVNGTDMVGTVSYPTTAVAVSLPSSENSCVTLVETETADDCYHASLNSMQAAAESVSSFWGCHHQPCLPSSQSVLSLVDGSSDTASSSASLWSLSPPPADEAPLLPLLVQFHQSPNKDLQQQQQEWSFRSCSNSGLFPAEPINVMGPPASVKRTTITTSTPMLMTN